MNGTMPANPPAGPPRSDAAPAFSSASLSEPSKIALPFSKQPLFPVAIFYAAGILTGSAFTVSPSLLLAASLGLAVVTMAWRRARGILLGLLVFLAGWTNLSLHTEILSPNDLRLILGDQPEIVTLRGTLHDTPRLRVIERGEQEAWRTMAQVDVAALRPNRQTWRPAAGCVAVTTPGEMTNLFAGQTVEITGVAGLPPIAVAEGTFDYRAYLKQLGIYYQLKAGSERDWQILASPAAAPLADRFRAWARRALALGLPVEDESLRLEWALTLGWKPALTEEVAEPFVQAATYHIFAVDGLRMAIVFGIFFGLFRVLGLPRAACGIVLLPLIWFYVALTGWPASAIRATVMLTVVIGGWILRRPVSFLNSLFAAAVIILVWQPQQLFQAGFQLSFLVVLCLILMLPPVNEFLSRRLAPDPLLPASLYPRWREWLRVPSRYLGDLLLTSFAAWVGSLPLVAYYFNIITPVSTPANVAAVPLCGLVLVSNLTSLMLAGWYPGAAELFNHAGWFLMECIRVSSHWFAGRPGAFFYIAAPTLFTSVLYYALLLAALTGWLFKPRLRAYRITLAVVPVLCWCWHCGRECAVTRLTILPANGGFAVYSDSFGTQNDLLVDCGNTNSVALVTKPFLRAQGVNRLSRLVLTHGDLRHVGGAEIVEDLFSVKRVCASPVRFRSPAYRRIMADVGQTSGRLEQVSRGSRLGAWTVLHPEPTDRFPQADDNALVLAGTFGGARVLLLSDLGRPGQDALLERTSDLRADIVVTGLPSASEALCDPLLDAIQPRAIIVADSEFQASERASPKLCERLAQRNVLVVYTRSSGAATIEFRGQGWNLRTMSGISKSSHDVAGGPK